MAKPEQPAVVSVKNEAPESVKQLAMNLRMLIEEGHAISDQIRFDRKSKHFFSKQVLLDTYQFELDKLNLKLAETLRVYGVTEISDEVRDEMGKLADLKREKNDSNLNENN